MKPHVGIDLMGGDLSPSVLLEAIAQLIDKLSYPLHLTFFGSKEILQSISFRNPLIETSFVESNEVISMDDDPLSAVRLKKEASMPLGIRKLKEGLIDALVTTGNTGALISCAKLFLGTLEGISRPALLTFLPTRKGLMAVLDVGANVDCNAQQLLEFAQMGLAYQQSQGISNARIGLLNIGTEEKKGTQELRKAYPLLAESLKENFYGNIEGREAFSGQVDVLVTDGFTGNIFLKTLEGVSQMALEKIMEKLKGNSSTEAKQLFSSLQKELDYTEYPGAVLCGVEGIVIKCHGNADPKALFKGVEKAVELIKGAFLEKIKAQLKSPKRV